MNRPWLAVASLTLLWQWGVLADGRRAGADEPAARVYQNRLTPIENPPPLLADYPEFVEPVQDVRRFESPRLIDDPAADLNVRGWRFSYNARGIIEVPNRLDASKTAVIVVHPWGIDDQQGWTTPEPAGVAFACTPEKNALMHQHAEQVVNPLLERLRSKVGLVMYSLPGSKDAVRGKMYRSFSGTPTGEERASGKRELLKTLRSFDYTGSSLPRQLPLTSGKPAIDYFRHFPGLDAGDLYNNAGFWKLPIPVMEAIDVHPGDVVIYDAEGYEALKTFLQDAGIEHVLLCGYHADMCVCKTTAGYENLRRDFNVFLVGDAVQSTFPANTTARHATNQTVSFAALDLFITQASWIRHDDDDAVAGASSRRQGLTNIGRTGSGRGTADLRQSAATASRDAADSHQPRDARRVCPAPDRRGIPPPATTAAHRGISAPATVTATASACSMGGRVPLAVGARGGVGGLGFLRAPEARMDATDLQPLFQRQQDRHHDRFAADQLAPWRMNRELIRHDGTIPDHSATSFAGGPIVGAAPAACNSVRPVHFF